MTLPAAEPTLLYVLDPMPAGRFPFRRWRWELWNGPELLATGWRTSEHHAERALRLHASRIAHRLRGLRPLRPEVNALSGALVAGAPARVQCGQISCLLLPRSG